MAIQEVLKLGNPKLYEVSQPVIKSDLQQLLPIVEDLHDTLLDFRSRYNAGRAIAAPQIGVMKRFIYMHITKPVLFFNPIFTMKSQ